MMHEKRAPLLTNSTLSLSLSPPLSQGKVDLTELWRPFTRLNGTTPEGGPVTKLAKMRGALGAYLPETDDSEDFLDDIFKVIQGQKSWGADLGY